LTAFHKVWKRDLVHCHDGDRAVIQAQEGVQRMRKLQKLQKLDFSDTQSIVEENSGDQIVSTLQHGISFVASGPQTCGAKPLRVSSAYFASSELSQLP